MNENREAAGTPAGGRFATSQLAEPSTSLPAPRPGHPDGPMVLTTFDIDGQFGSLVGYDDGRRWNGFAQPWLTQESLARVKAATAAWAQVDSEVEWLDDGPDGVWRLHTSDEPPIDLEQAVSMGPQLETLHRLSGWCWSEHADEAETLPQLAGSANLSGRANGCDTHTVHTQCQTPR